MNNAHDIDNLKRSNKAAVYYGHRLLIEVTCYR